METGPAEAVAHFMRTWSPDDPARRIVPQTDHRCGKRAGIRWRMRTGRGHPHRPRGREGFLLEGRDQHWDYPDVRWHPATPRNVGRKAAIELILTGRTFDATEAARLGLINRVVPGFDLLAEAVELAETLATKPPLTLAAALAAIHRGMDASIDDGLAIEEAAFASIVPTHDAREGVAAFLEKRRPTFLGR